jgi:Ca2+-binding EF-hand superfamily protein/dienelactone hydrolase
VVLAWLHGESFIRQIFLQDPDGHYIEICDCQKIEKFVHGLEDAAEIIYQEGVKPSAATLAAVTGMMWNGGLDEAEQLERMWRAFKIHAGDDDFIDASDFDDLLRRMGIQAGSADYRELLKAIDKGGDGRISFPEAMYAPCPSFARTVLTEISLCHACSCQEILRVITTSRKFLAGRLQRSGSSRMDVEQDMRTAFEVYDADGSGTVSLHELRALLYSVGNRLTEEELERAFDVADRDSSGSISFEEFLVVFNQMQSVAVSVAAEEDDAAGAAGVVSPADVGIIKFRNPMQDLGGAVGVDPFNEHLDERTHIDVESCEGVFMDEAWRAMTVSSPPPQRPTTGTLRTRVLSLLERPSAPLAPTSVSDTKAQDGFRHERWRLQSEPGDHGVVPVLLVGPPKRSKVPLPVVVVLHGTHGSKDDMLPHLQRYAGLGFLACAIDSRYLGERGGDDAYVEALLAAFHSNRTTKNAKKRKPKKKGGGAAQRPFMYDTVWDLMRLADWLESRPDVDASRIGITGVSLGGMHAWLAAAADERFAACAPLIGVQGYRWAIDNEQWHGRVGSIKPVFDSIAEHYGRDIDSEMVRA